MCCGRQTFPMQDSTVPSNAASIPPAAAHSSLPVAASFEYIGETALTVFSPLTGRKYRFRHPGDRVEVDVRDGSWMPFVPKLRRAAARTA